MIGGGVAYVAGVVFFILGEKVSMRMKVCSWCPYKGQVPASSGMFQPLPLLMTFYRTVESRYDTSSATGEKFIEMSSQGGPDMVLNFTLLYPPPEKFNAIKILHALRCL